MEEISRKASSNQQMFVPSGGYMLDLSSKKLMQVVAFFVTYTYVTGRSHVDTMCTAIINRMLSWCVWCGVS